MPITVVENDALTPAERARLTWQVELLPNAQLAAEYPDAHRLLLDDDTVRARCSAWWDDTAALDGQPIGAVGHYAACDADAGRALLNHACDLLASYGRSVVVGPMDGNTWRRYRYITERGDEPPFLLEPDNPPDYPAHFDAAGFEPLAQYVSTLVENLSIADPRMGRVEQRLDRLGVRISALDPAEFERQLRRIHALSLVAFANNFLYTPIAEDEFVAQYLAVQQHVERQLVLLAERGEDLVGFMFAVPDLAQAARGETVDTVILKTVAVQPGRDYAGLGNLLVARCHNVAQSLGYRRAIHALMHESNDSLNLSARYGRVFRRYTLYARSLSNTSP